MALAWATAAVSDNHNKGSLTVPGVRDIRSVVTTNPKILSLKASEKIRSTVQLEVHFIQLTECNLGKHLVGRVQNVADQMAASGAAEQLKNRFKADISAVNKATLYTGSNATGGCSGRNTQPGDEAHARKIKAAVKNLKARGFIRLEPVTKKFGNISIDIIPWVRKTGSSGADFGEIRGRVDLKLVPNIDTKTFIYKGKFKTVAGPEFEVRNPPPRGPARRQAKEQYDAFKKHFNEAYLELKEKLEFRARLFKNVESVRKFKFYSKVGEKITRQKNLSIPFMGNRQKYRIKVVLIAGKWRDKFPIEGAGDAPKSYKDFDKSD